MRNTEHGGERRSTNGRVVPLPPSPLDRTFHDEDLGAAVQRELTRLVKYKKKLVQG